MHVLYAYYVLLATIIMVRAFMMIMTSHQGKKRLGAQIGLILSERLKGENAT